MEREYRNGRWASDARGSWQRWRWVIFVRSILSTVDNPGGEVWRGLGLALDAAGQDVLFLEERANPAVTALLRQQGARALRDFTRNYPQLRYHTYERRFGADLVEWLGRTLATADVAVVEVGVDPVLAGWVGALTRPHLQTYLLDVVDTAATAQWRAHLLAGPDSTAPGALDLSAFSGVACAEAWVAAYAARLPETHMVRLPVAASATTPSDSAHHLGYQLATLILARVAAAPPRRDDE